MSAATAADNSSSKYVICNNISSLKDALAVLRSSSSVILDCEGRDLGQQGGLLSLITLRTISPTSSETFIIDAISIGGMDLRPLLDFLGSPATTKIVFDGRMDFSALYHEYGTTLEGVLDLQLADVRSRVLRGESEDDQLRRLSPYIHKPEVLAQRTFYTQVHKLAGLEQAIKEHGVIAKPRTSVIHQNWCGRPLPEPYLRYAALDVHLIGLLLEHFQSKGYIDSALGDQSMRYISIWKTAQPKPTDKFKGHPLLPLEILDSYPFSFTKRCNNCDRNLSQNSFSKTAWRLDAKRRCLVCRAVDVNDHIHAQWERDDFDLDDGYGYSDDHGYGCDLDYDDGYGCDPDYDYGYGGIWD